jgi:signal transduction histidine kinase/CheY-like chemotaxis protein
MTQERTQPDLSRLEAAAASLDAVSTRLLCARPGILLTVIAAAGAASIANHLKVVEGTGNLAALMTVPSFAPVVIFACVTVALLAFTIARLTFTIDAAKAGCEDGQALAGELVSEAEEKRRLVRRLEEAKLRLESNQASFDKWSKQLDEADEKVRDLNAVKIQFLSDVAHELRGPIAAMVSAGKIIGKHHATKPEIVGRFSTTVVSEGDRLNHIINDFLDLTKIESGTMPWAMDDIDVAEVVSRATLAVETVALEHGVIIDSQIGEDVGMIYGDADRITQALTNLLINGIKLSPNGSVVTVSASHGDRRTYFAVHDSGPGIAAEDAAKAFDRFHKVSTDGDKSKKARGTGLGLCIAKHVAERCGGQIWIDTALGEGSTFSFTIPDDTSAYLSSATRGRDVKASTSQSIRVAFMTAESDLIDRALRIPHGAGVECRTEETISGLSDLLESWRADCIVVAEQLMESLGPRVLECAMNHGLREVLVYSESTGLTARAIRESPEIAVRRMRYLASHGATVLVVEDDEDYQGVVTFELEQAGYNVVHATDGEEALRVINKQKIDAMILDIIIPRLDGLSILEALSESGKRIPALILTGIDDPDVTLQAKQLGAIEVVHKHGVDDIARAAVVARAQRVLLPALSDRLVNLEEESDGDKAEEQPPQAS